MPSVLPPAGRGSRWWKCDLHLHTPASPDWPDKTTTPEQWVGAAIQRGVEVVAVTDHHGHAWIARIQQAAGDRLVVFPGVEIKVSEGCHLLAVFDVGTSPDAVAALLGASGILAEQFGKDGAISPHSFVSVAEKVSQHHGVCLAAHADGKAGFLTQFVKVAPNGVAKGEAALQQIVSCVHLLGVEVKGSDPSVLAFTDNTKESYKRPGGPLPLLEASDAHIPSDIGSRHTWIKMSRPNLEGLRLALLDGPASVRRGSEVSANLNETAVDRIEDIEIQDAKYLGRPQPFRLVLSPWLNSLIGGHGTGKSSLVEFLRLAMRREQEVPEPLRNDFAKYTEVFERRQDRGLLTQQTAIRVHYKRDGSLFRIQWSQDGSLTPIEVRGSDGAWTTAPGEVRDRFPIRIFSQKQIYQLAEQPNALLEIVDEAGAVAAQAMRVQLDEEEKRFRSLRAKLRELESTAGAEERLRGQLDEVRRKMAVFETSQHREVLAAYRTSQAQKRALEDWGAGLETAVKGIESLPEQLVLDDIDRTVFPTTPSPDGPEQSVLARVAQAAAGLASLRSEVERLGQRARRVSEEFGAAITDSPWNAHLAAVQAQYDDLKKRLASAGAGDPSEYGRLVQERETTESKLKTIEARRKTSDEVREQAAASLRHLAESRNALTIRRQDYLAAVLAGNPDVVIELVPYGDRDDAVRKLREAIGRSADQTFQDQIWSENGNEGVLSELYEQNPPEADVPAFLAGLEAMKARLIGIARGGDAGGLHGKFVGHLRRLQPEALERIETLFPEDAVRVRYRPRPGDDLKPIEQGSPGQKSAAILAFLLSQGNEPLVLDQPEDDLDGQLISALIVGQLRKIKSKRQALVVTHNPNIVVNGDAELITCLGVAGGQTQILTQGGLQERAVRDEICGVMEGGRDALDRRYKRIRAGAEDV